MTCILQRTADRIRNTNPLRFNLAAVLAVYVASCCSCYLH